MVDTLTILLAGVFLPLFPMSMVFNAILEKVSYVWLRALLFLLWPMCGLFFINSSNMVVPDWVLQLALATSTLYALRLLSLREVNQWCGFLAISLWSLLWLVTRHDIPVGLLYAYAASMSLPLVLLVLLSSGLEQRFGAAYTGLYGGLARTIPRFAGVLVTVVVAAIATPLFPTFFIVFSMVVYSISIMPLATGFLLFIWLLWSWAGARLIQGLIVGRASDAKIVDLGMVSVFIYSIALLSLVITGVYMGGIIL